MRAVPSVLACLLLCACASSAPPTPTAPSSSEAERPAAPALILPVAEELALGRPSAWVALVVISDFQCPYCRRLHQDVLPAIKTRYVDTGRVRLYHKDFPLPMHKQAFPAALAARCAAHEGRLWPMQDKLYEAPALSPAVYTQAATVLELDRTRFEACMLNPSTRAVVDRDRMEAMRLGVNSTPTVVLGYLDNGAVRVERIARGIPPVETFVEEIEALLAR